MTINSETRLTELSNRTKPAAVAGYFYPDDPSELKHVLTGLLGDIKATGSPPKAIVAPHAGYIYSGPIAANAYSTLAPVRKIIKRVVLLGPAHRVYVKGLAIASATHFATPLGDIAVDTNLLKSISNLKQVSIMDEAFAQEHSLEVHLPFLQSVLENFTLLPIVVGEASAEAVAEVLETVWGGNETLIVVSSDLSHFHDYETARGLDHKTADYIKNRQYDKLGPEQACGCRPINGLLKLAEQKNMVVELLDLRNSGDTAGSLDRVVGYGAFTLRPSDEISIEDQTQLLGIARQSIHHGLNNNEALHLDMNNYPEALRQARAVFVTLTLDGQLRGCIGNTDPVYPLSQAVAINAYNAAFHDPRFTKLSKAEFSKLDIDISVLTPRQEVHFTTEQELLQQLQAGIDGLIIDSGQGTATFLPSVWEKLTDPIDFLTQLKRKAGMSVNTVPVRAWKYQSHSFS
jgi:AmmeMemoRadiSam system protein B/AmmeMemoRadiSam system protein A